MIYIYHIIKIRQVINLLMALLNQLICNQGMASLMVFLACTTLLGAVLGLECQPYGLRMSLGYSYVNASSTEQMTFQFNTLSPCNRSYIQLNSAAGPNLTVLCSSNLLAFGTYFSYVQECSVSRLKEGEDFTYSAFGWSGRAQDTKVGYKELRIRAHLPRRDQSFRMVVLGDWGYLQTQSALYSSLEGKFNELLQSGDIIDAILILGDVAYDLDSNNGLNYEYFIRMISQVSSRWPVIFPPGNHQRLTPIDRLVYSSSFEAYDMDQTGVSVLHLPFFNLLLYDPYEIVFLNQTGTKLYQTFQAQLAAHSDTLTIVAAHYPYMCSGPDSDCIDKPRKQMKFFQEMIKQNVPLYLSAHYHTYERNYPTKANQQVVFQEEPYSWSASTPEADRQMIAITNGIAGSDTFLDEAFEGVVKPFTAAHSYKVTGFGVIEVGEDMIQFQELLTNHPNPVDFWSMHLDRSIPKAKRGLKYEEK